jgi:hypothetical protein
MTSNNSGCLTAFVGSFSRLLLLMEWIARPAQMNLAFNTFIIPCLGVLFLPVTTLVYVWLVQGVGGAQGIQGLDWLWLGLALLMDIATFGSAGYANRNRMPGYNPGQTYTAVQDPTLAPPAQPPAPKQ